MININNTLIAGGNYSGGKDWDKEASNLDKCFKLYYVQEGRAFLYNNNEKYEVAEGGLYFINGFKIKRQSCPVLFRVNWLHFTSDSIFIKQALLKQPLVSKLNTAINNEVLSDFLLFEPFFKAYSNRDKWVSQNVLATYFKIQSLIVKLTGVITENYGSEYFHLSGQGSRLLKAVEYIDANYKSTITLKHLASLCYISENYFHNLFKQEFTVTPNKYILQMRMNEALNLLSNTNLSVNQVAGECGYFDAAYFSRTFSKYFGMSPNKYRSLHSNRTP